MYFWSLNLTFLFIPNLTNDLIVAYFSIAKQTLKIPTINYQSTLKVQVSYNKPIWKFLREIGLAETIPCLCLWFLPCLTIHHGIQTLPPTTSIFLSLGHLLITHFFGWDLPPLSTSTKFSMHKNWRLRSNFFQVGPLSGLTKILISTALWILVREWEGDLYRSNKLRICKFLQIASKRGERLHLERL